MNFPLFITTSAGNTERSETTRGEFSDFVLVIIDDLFRERMIFLDSSKDEKRGTFDTDETFAFRGFDDSSDFLRDRIEGVELDDFVLAENSFRTGIVTKRL